MARIRTIKPTFFTSLTIADLTLEQRLTFIGLWTHCDDEGRCIYDPRLIKAALWPLSDRSIAEVADDVRVLVQAGLVIHYRLTEDSVRAHGGLTEGSRSRSFLSITGWSEHQKVNRPTKSTLPPPESGELCPVTCDDSDSLRTHGGLTEDSLRTHCGKGKEGKGREGKELPSSPTSSATDRESDPYLFTEFWEQYPRKVGKNAARKAWHYAIRKTNPDEIIKAAGRMARDPNLPDQQFIPHPTTWLNRGGWDDAPYPPRNRDQKPSSDDRVRAGLTLAQRLAAQESEPRLEITQ